MLKELAVIFFLGLALVGCTSVNAGTVIGKRYTAAYWYWSSQCVAYGRNGGCTVSVPVQESVPAEYDLCLRDDSENRPANQRDTSCVEVTPADYERYQVGEHYP